MIIIVAAEVLGIKPIKSHEQGLKIWNDTTKDATERNIKYIEIIYSIKLKKNTNR